MPETYYGAWLIDVVRKSADYSQQYVVTGSDRADGIYVADLGTAQLHVTGAEWTLALEWNDNAGSGWQASRTLRREMTFTPADGLVVVLGVDDNWVQIADNDFNDVVLRCQNIDPHLIPWHPFKRTMDFSLPKRGGGDGGVGDRPCEPTPPKMDRHSHPSLDAPGAALSRGDF